MNRDAIEAEIECVQQRLADLDVERNLARKVDLAAKLRASASFPARRVTPEGYVRKDEVDDLVASYGRLVVDECHHLSAVTFERVVRRAKARYVLGLSATVARKDGHHPIIFMQCGPVRHKVDARTHGAEATVRHIVRERTTRFQLPEALATAERPMMPAIYAAIGRNEARNDLIFDDVLHAIEEKRSPIVLTERKDHLLYLANRFNRFVKNIVVLSGGLSAVERKRADAAPEVEERLILATGRYIGEGFDDTRLDTLFLTMPISWKGALAQYVGRLHRRHSGKTDVVVVDYVDAGAPVLARMAARRRAEYRSLAACRTEAWAPWRDSDFDGFAELFFV